MTTKLNPPPERDFPEGRLVQRQHHLIAETSAKERTAVVPSTEQRSIRKLVAGLAVSAVTATVIMFGISPGEEPGSLPQLGVQAASAAAVEVTTTDGFYDIVFVTLAEDATQVEADLQALGLDVSIDFVPVSGSLAGKLVATDSPAGADGVWEYTDPATFDGPSVLHIPTDFDGTLRLDIGRPASTGEDFVSSAQSALHPGEVLHCTNVEGMTVSEATSVIAGAGATVEYVNTGDGVVYGTSVPDAQQSWYIVATTPIAGGIVQADLMSFWPDDGRTAEYLAYLSEGCG